TSRRRRSSTSGAPPASRGPRSPGSSPPGSPISSYSLSFCPNVTMGFPCNGSVTGRFRACKLSRASCSIRLPETVTDPPHRLDARRRDTLRGELGAQPRDVHVHCPRLHEPVLAPDLVQQLVTTEDPARCSHQDRKELEFLGCHLHPSSHHRDLETMPIDLEVTGPEMGLLAIGRPRLAPPHDRPHAGEKLARGKRLRDVVIGPHLEAQHLVPFLDAAGHHDHRDAS